MPLSHYRDLAAFLAAVRTGRVRRGSVAVVTRYVLAPLAPAVRADLERALAEAGVTLRESATLSTRIVVESPDEAG